MERLIGFDLQWIADAVLAGINILILFFILSYLLFNPVRDFLKKRREKIAAQLSEAAQKDADASELKAEYESKLKNIEKEAAHIMDEARRKAKMKEEEIISEAKEEAGRITKRAMREIELEREKAVDEVRKEMVHIAALMATKALASGMDVKIQNDLIDETLREIGESTWQS